MHLRLLSNWEGSAIALGAAGIWFKWVPRWQIYLISRNGPFRWVSGWTAPQQGTAGRHLPRSFAVTPDGRHVVAFFFSIRHLVACSWSSGLIFSAKSTASASLFLLTGSEKPLARRSCWRRHRAVSVQSWRREPEVEVDGRTRRLPLACIPPPSPSPPSPPPAPPLRRRLLRLPAMVFEEGCAAVRARSSWSVAA